MTADRTQSAREGFSRLPGDAGLAMLLLDAEGRELERLELSRGRSLFPLGSVFKLYVLAELARQVATGRIDPAGSFPIREELKSLPTGEMQLLRAGTLVEVRHAAEQMIAISDNTATDHLIDLLGRHRIEENLARYGNSSPERNTPFLLSREMFLLKGAGSRRLRSVFGTGSMPEIAGLWVQADSDRRRAWLELLRERMAEFSFEPLQGLLATGYRVASCHPQHAEIEWVARPADIVELLRRAHSDELVSPEASAFFLDVLAQGRPFHQGPGVAQHGFKAGRERGITAYALRVVLDDGRSLLACLSVCGMSLMDMREVDDIAEALETWVSAMLADPARRTSSR